MSQGGARKGEYTYGGSGGPDTVEHVGSEGDGDEEIFRIADAHDVAGFVLWEPVGAGVHAVGGFVFHDQPIFRLRDEVEFSIPIPKRTPYSKKPCPPHRTVRLSRSPAYPSSPSPRSTLSSSPDPDPPG